MAEAVMSDMDLNERGRAFDPDATGDEKTYSMFMHLTLLLHAVVPGFAIAAPIIMWMSRREDSPYIDDHGRATINFQITLIIYTIVLPILAIPVGLLLCGVGLVITIPAAVLLPYVLGIIGMTTASIAANRGEYYRYPMTFQFLH